MKKYLLLKIIFITFIIILLFLFNSCSPDSMAYMAGNTWNGELNNFGRFGDADIEDATFHPKGEVTMTIKFDDSGHEEDIDLKGTYKIDSNYNFDAILYSNDDYINSKIFPNVDAVEYRLEMEGTLNGYTGKGDGEYKMKCTVHLDNGTSVSERIDDDWELTKSN